MNKSDLLAYLLVIPEVVIALTVRTPCHNPASLLKSRTLVIVSPENKKGACEGAHKEAKTLLCSSLNNQMCNLN